MNKKLKIKNLLTLHITRCFFYIYTIMSNQKTLIIVRHAKSDWTIEGQRDFDRDLNQRGYRDAPRMAMQFSQTGFIPDLIISSPAKRARITAGFFAERLEYNEEDIAFDDSIYESTVGNILSIINSIEEDYSNVMIFGHNPAFTYIVEYLSDYDLVNLPTCGIIRISFEVETWAEISKSTGNVDSYMFPKEVLS